MRTVKYIDKPTETLVSLTCDKCLKEYTVDNDDEMELQEFLAVDFVGGYSSVFGDGTTVRCDICQHCLRDIIKDFMVTSTFTQL